MKISKGMNPVARAVGVFSAVAIIAGGVTYAALQSSATLTGNTITSANASLLLYDGVDFAPTAPGFNVTGLIPGEGSEENKFYVKNAGDTALKVTAFVPTEPETPVEGFGFSGYENLKVKFTSLSPECTDEDSVKNTTMAALLAGEVELPCNPISERTQGDNTLGQDAKEGNYSVSFDIAADAVTGETAAVGNFNIRFTGTAVDDDDVELL